MGARDTDLPRIHLDIVTLLHQPSHPYAGQGWLGSVSGITCWRSASLQRSLTAPIATANSTKRHVSTTAKRTHHAMAAITSDGMVTKISSSITHSAHLR